MTAKIRMTSNNVITISDSTDINLVVAFILTAKISTITPVWDLPNTVNKIRSAQIFDMLFEGTQAEMDTTYNWIT